MSFNVDLAEALEHAAELELDESAASYAEMCLVLVRQELKRKLDVLTCVESLPALLRSQKALTQVLDRETPQSMLEYAAWNIERVLENPKEK